MRCGWGEGEEDGEEGVLEEDGLPEFATDLLFEDAGIGTNDVRISMEAHGIGLTN